MPFLFAHLPRVWVESHFLPVQMGLGRLVLGQIFFWQVHLHGIQQLQQVILLPNCNKTQGKNNLWEPINILMQTRKAYTFVLHTKCKYRFTCSGRHGSWWEQFVLQGNYCHEYEPTYSKHLTLNARYTFDQTMNSLGIKPMLYCLNHQFNRHLESKILYSHYGLWQKICLLIFINNWEPLI